MKFVKMHGLGNDFVFFEDKQGADKDFSQLAVKLCAPHTGVGADGIIVIVPSDKADVRMRIINATAVKLKCAATASVALQNTSMTIRSSIKKNLPLKHWPVL